MSYDLNNNYELIKFTNSVPKEIIGFLEETFRIIEVRERVGTERGIVFEIRTKERNHCIPHVHASYGEYSISICIDTCEVLEGKLPPKQIAIAVQWVSDHKDDLLNKWSSITVNAISCYTKSELIEVL